MRERTCVASQYVTRHAMARTPQSRTATLTSAQLSWRSCAMTSLPVQAPLPWHSRVGQDEVLLPEHLPGDDELLDLAGAFVDPEQPYVAVQPFDRHAADVPGAAVDLDCAVSDPADRLAGEILRRRRCEPPVGARVVLDRGVEHQG